MESKLINYLLEELECIEQFNWKSERTFYDEFVDKKLRHEYYNALNTITTMTKNKIKEQILYNKLKDIIDYDLNIKCFLNKDTSQELLIFDMIYSAQTSLYICLITEHVSIMFGEDRGHPFIITNKFKVINSHKRGPFNCRKLELKYKNKEKLYDTLMTFLYNTCNNEYC